MEIEKEVYFRGIQPSDYEQLKLLHEVFFPVRYSENFYRDACNGIGTYTGFVVTVSTSPLFHSLTIFVITNSKV